PHLQMDETEVQPHGRIVRLAARQIFKNLTRFEEMAEAERGEAEKVQDLLLARPEHERRPQLGDRLVELFRAPKLRSAHEPRDKSPGRHGVYDTLRHGRRASFAFSR